MDQIKASYFGRVGFSYIFFFCFVFLDGFWITMISFSFLNETYLKTKNRSVCENNNIFTHHTEDVNAVLQTQETSARPFQNWVRLRRPFDHLSICWICFRGVPFGWLVSKTIIQCTQTLHLFCTKEGSFSNTPLPELLLENNIMPLI